MISENLSSSKLPRTTQPLSLEMDKEFNIYEKLLITIATGIIIINIYVTSLFVRKPSLRKNSSLLLFSLTMADLFTGFVTVPLITAAKPAKPPYAVFLHIFGDIATVLSASLTIMSLCAVTADRYVRLCYPMKHMMVVRRKRIVALFIFIWIVAFVYALIPLSWLYRVLKANSSNATYKAVDKMDTRYSIIGAALFAIPILGLTMAFLRMFYAIRKLGQDEQRISLEMGQEERRRKRERKAIVLFGSMFSLFIICWVPWITLRPFVSTAVFAEIPEVLLNILVVTRFLSSLLNPVLYTLHEQNFYRALIADKDRLVMYLKGARGRHRSTSGDSGNKLPLYHYSRKGTLVSSLKSQDCAENTTSFIPSPFPIRKNACHNGNSSSTGHKANGVEDDLPNLPLCVQPKNTSYAREPNPIAWNRPITSTNDFGEDGLKFSNQGRNFDDGKTKFDETSRGEITQCQRDIFDEKGSEYFGVKLDEIETINRNLKSKAYHNINEPVSLPYRDEVVETRPMLQQDNHERFDEPSFEPGWGDITFNKKNQTKKLLKTSLIGKIFNANDLDYI